jgi:hypothetical protein
MHDLYFNASQDGGATWGATDVRIDVGFASDPSSFVGAHGIASQGPLVVAVWSEMQEGPYMPGVFANRSADAGATWLAYNPRISEDMGQEIASLGLAAVGTSVYAVWEDDRDDAPALYCDRSLDGGLTWMDEDVRIATSSTAPKYGPFDSAADLAVSGTSLYVVWEDNRNSPSPGGSDEKRDIYFNRSLDGGLTLLPQDVRLDLGGTQAGDSRHPRIAVQGTAVYVVWDDDLLGQRDILFNRSLDAGASWLQRAARLDRGTPPGATPSYDPRIAVTGSTVFAVWRDGRNGSADVYFSRSVDAGGSWLASDVRLDTGDAPGSIPSADVRIATEGAGLLVVWHDWKRTTSTEPGYNRIGFNRSSDAGDTWLATSAFVSDSDHARGPAIACGASSAYVAWSDTRHPNGWSDIYFTMPAGHQPYGAGTPGSGGFVPVLRADGLPCAGATFTFAAEQGLGGATLLVLSGLGGKAGVPWAGGMLLVQGPYVHASALLGGTPGEAGAGAASVPIVLPNDPTLIGLRVNTQGGVLDAAAQKGVALTRALETWVY